MDEFKFCIYKQDFNPVELNHASGQEGILKNNIYSLVSAVSGWKRSYCPQGILEWSGNRQLPNLEKTISGVLFKLRVLIKMHVIY